MSVAKNKEIYGIQYLRGIAASAVVLFHATEMAALPKYFGRAALGGFFLNGFMGVDLFFLISGFIICIVSLRDDGLQPRIGAYEFGRRRLLRIVPMMWLAVLTYMLLRWFSHTVNDMSSYVRAFFFWPVGSVSPVQMWTLRIEVIFYLIFGVSFLTLKARPWVLGIWVLVPFVYTLIGLPEHPRAWLEWVRALAPPAAIEFSVGLVIGVFFVKKKIRLYPPTAWLWLKLAVLFCLAMYLLGFFPKNVEVAYRVVYALGVAPILLYSVSTSPVRVSRIGALLGDASYSIYLFHLHCLPIAFMVLSKYDLVRGASSAVLIATLSAIVFGIAIHLFIERPLLARIHNIGKSRGG